MPYRIISKKIRGRLFAPFFRESTLYFLFGVSLPVLVVEFCIPTISGFIFVSGHISTFLRTIIHFHSVVMEWEKD